MSENNNTFMHKDRLAERGLDEFIGICKGLIFDGVVTNDEAVNLLAWLNANQHVAQQWPATEIWSQLNAMLENRSLTTEDEGRLLASLTYLTGNPDVLHAGDNASTQLPLCDPPPEVYFKSALFAVTGNLSMGSREQFADLIQSLGWRVNLRNVRKDTNFLVIGDIGSKAWMHSTHGRKIERAVELRDTLKTGIGIISEAHFMASLPNMAITPNSATTLPR